jgi:hypothetical protein
MSKLEQVGGHRPPLQRIIGLKHYFFLDFFPPDFLPPEDLDACFASDRNGKT